MASMVAQGSASGSSQVSPLLSVQEKGSRNKRKFRADQLLGEPNKLIPSMQNECLTYEFSAEKFEGTAGHGQSGVCDLCGIGQDHSDGLKLDLGLASAVISSEVGPSRPREELEMEGFHDADWSDHVESQLEELVLSNLDTIFKSAIKKIVACGYTEEVATKAILRSGLCYGCKDIVSNIVDNTLAFLRSGQEIDPSRQHCFEDLQQLEKYILAELVCVLREVRPFFSTGDAMWCLLICDMNVSHACAMDGDSLSNFIGDGASDGTSSIPSQTQSKTDAVNSEVSLPNPCSPTPSTPCSQSEEPTVAVVPNTTKLKNSAVLSELASDKEGPNSTSDTVSKSFGVTVTSKSAVLEEKFGSGKKVHSVSSKREYILRQKSLHLEKSYRTYGSKGSSRAGKLSGLGGLILDKKLKSVSESTAVHIKNASLKISKAMGVDVPQDSQKSQGLPNNPGSSSPRSFNSETGDAISALPKTIVPATLPPVNAAALPALSSPPALSTADTELSLSLPAKSNSAPIPVNCNPGIPNSFYAGMPYDKSVGQWVPRDKKDEMILKLALRVRELQNQLQEWTEWANEKVMQAARRLSKDKAELKTLRQEKEEVERLKKEKQSLEENTMKKLAEMENALFKASGQVEKANTAVRRLEVENAGLRQEMEAAKLSAAKSAASCQEVSKREKKTLMNCQSWEKQKTLFQEELVTEKRKVAQLLQELEQAKQLQEQHEGRWHQEEKAKEELLLQASSLTKERQQIETSTKSKEDHIKLKAETNLQKYKDDIQKLEKEISQLRLKTDSSKIAALRRGIDGSYGSRLTDIKDSPDQKESWIPYVSEVVTNFHDYSETGGVKRERECVMCLSEEMSVVFLPCAHQVVCTTCNELHEKQGMKECPSCRSPIQRRITVRFARS
ncbi:putative E3 ubiquitin-protein ligase [Tripterygium wilfordii]|uniref:Putative E3 ubiquitin-protein ligase n=1 Tax=Tripterygium wilfordii TaxID=458696 RepID=A0A7J7CSF1_TRIWF|nr:putative E3 ubiquitin-protein ligase RF298 [Tripterygium wilfordii]XP_038722306.1 putative E3 ubiquitin-protein ligase RF298 [Tripterygium wilfordii]XP_038722307.1 putative E3 ubiquitin-protein ligase RF298 [Tripterygium wilfordii]KAF5736899.1 putative E3 ubiquitin-protein ligase [Tripterygium wilfordii]